MRGRNDLKSKVSTLEKLYDFFSKNTQKITSRDVIFGAGDICRQARYLLYIHIRVHFIVPYINRYFCIFQFIRYCKFCR